MDYLRFDLDQREVEKRVILAWRSTASDQLDARDGLILGLVGQHRPVSHVADGPDRWDLSLAAIGVDKTVSIQDDTDILKAAYIYMHRSPSKRSARKLGIFGDVSIHGPVIPSSSAPNCSGHAAETHLGPGSCGAT